MITVLDPDGLDPPLLYNPGLDPGRQVSISVSGPLAYQLLRIYHSPMPGEAKVPPRSYIVYVRREFSGTQYWGSVTTKTMDASLAFNALDFDADHMQGGPGKVEVHFFDERPVRGSAKLFPRTLEGCPYGYAYVDEQWW